MYFYVCTNNFSGRVNDDPKEPAWVGELSRQNEACDTRKEARECLHYFYLRTSHRSALLHTLL